MTKKFTCIQCPLGCQLVAEIENGCLVKLEGNKCPKGEQYAKQEIENPLRTITSIIMAEGLSIKMVPVKTDQPLPKNKIFEAMEEIKKIKINKPVSSGDIIINNFLGLNVNLITTREVL